MDDELEGGLGPTLGVLSCQEEAFVLNQKVDCGRHAVFLSFWGLDVS